MVQQALTKINQGGGMKDQVPEMAIEGEVPARVIPEHLHSLAIRNGLQILQETYAQKQDRLNGHPSVFGAVALFQLRTSLGQDRINLSGEEAKAVFLREEGVGKQGGGKKFGLGAEFRQTHGISCG